MTHTILSCKIVVTSSNLSRVYAELKVQAIAAGLLDSKGYAKAIQCGDEITLTDEQRKLVQQLSQVDVAALVDDTVNLLTYADQLMPQALKPYYNTTDVQKEEVCFYRQTLSHLHSYQQLSEVEQQQEIQAKKACYTLKKIVIKAYSTQCFNQGNQIGSYRQKTETDAVEAYVATYTKHKGLEGWLATVLNYRGSIISLHQTIQQLQERQAQTDTSALQWVAQAAAVIEYLRETEHAAEAERIARRYSFVPGTFISHQRITSKLYLYSLGMISVVLLTGGIVLSALFFPALLPTAVTATILCGVGMLWKMTVSKNEPIDRLQPTSSIILSSRQGNKLTSTQTTPSPIPQKIKSKRKLLLNCL